MANSNAPTGFTPIGTQIGAAWNSNQTNYTIASGDSTAVFKGDPVTLLNTGYVTRSTAGTTTIQGIFWGCTYQNAVTGYPVYSNYWPGSGSSGDVTVYIIDDPNATFEVQATSTAITSADIGANVQFALGTGNTTTGLSGATVAVGTPTTSTLPFRVIALKAFGNGSDATSSYNRVIVAFNNQAFKQTTGV
jgi:hypothetical protein